MHREKYVGENSAFSYAVEKKTLCFIKYKKGKNIYVWEIISSNLKPIKKKVQGVTKISEGRGKWDKVQRPLKNISLMLPNNNLKIKELTPLLHLGITSLKKIAELRTEMSVYWLRSYGKWEKWENV